MKTILPVAAVVVAVLDILIVFLLRGVPDVQLVAIYGLVVATVYLAGETSEEDV